MLKSQLKAPCMDCKEAYICAYSDLANKNSLIPSVKDTIIYCKHQNVCPVYNESDNPLLFIPMSMVDLASLGVDVGPGDKDNVEEADENA